MREGADDTGGVIVRPMVRPDLPAVVALERATFTTPWSTATFRGLLSRRDVDALVAELDGDPVGYTVGWSVLEQGELANIALVPSVRGSGIAALLMESLLERLRARGVAQVFLEVRESNQVARRFYQRFGFREVGRRRRYYVKPEEDALVLYRGLDAHLAPAAQERRAPAAQERRAPLAQERTW